LAQQVLQVQLVLKVQQDRKVYKVLKDLQVLQVRLARLALAALLLQQTHLQQAHLLAMLGLTQLLDRSTFTTTAIGLSLHRVTSVTLALLDQPAQVVDQPVQLVPHLQ
jgi:hypothetical protein